MEPDKLIILRLWNNKWSRWLLIIALLHQTFAGLGGMATKIHTFILKPTYIYLSGNPPDADIVSSQRHSFWVGYYTYETYHSIVNRDYIDWPHAFADTRSRLEASLIALKFPDAKLTNNIDTSDPMAAMSHYFRLRHLYEQYIDSKSKKDLNAYEIGLHLSILLKFSSNSEEDKKTIKEYVDKLIENITYLRSNSTYRIRALEIESFDSDSCCNSFHHSLANDFTEIKRYFGIPTTAEP